MLSGKAPEVSFAQKLRSSVKSYTLDNGLKVVLLKDDSAPQVTITLAWGVGMAHEPEDLRGISTIMLEMFFSATQKMSQSDFKHICLLNELEAWVLKRLYFDTTAYSAVVNKRLWKFFLSIFADCSQNLVFKEQQVVSKIHANMPLYFNDWSFDIAEFGPAKQEIFRQFFPEGHPYYNLFKSYYSEYLSLNSEQLLAFYKKYYTIDNATLVILGDIDYQKTLDEVKSLFGSYLTKKTYPEIIYPPALKPLNLVPITKFKHRNVENDWDEASISFTWSIPGVKEDKGMQSFILQFCSEIFCRSGYSPHSRIYETLESCTNRVTHQLNVYRKGGIGGEAFVVSISSRQHKIDQCKEILTNELKRLLDAPLDDVEFQEIKASAKAYLNVKPGHTFDFVLKIALSEASNTATPEACFDELAQIENFTAQDLHDFIKKHLSFENLLQINVLPGDAEFEAQYQKAVEAKSFHDQEFLKNRFRKLQAEPLKLAKEFEAELLPKVVFPRPTLIFTLKNGLQVIAVDRKTSSGVTTFLLQSMNQQWWNNSLEGNTSLKTAIGLLSMCDGSTEAIKDLATLGATVSFEHTGVQGIIPTANFATGFDLLAKLIAQRKITTEDLAKQVEQSVEQINASKTDSLAVTNRIKNNLLYKGTPFHWTFDDAIEKINKLDLGQIENMFNEYFVPQKLFLVVVGNLPEDLQEVVESSALSELLDMRVVEPLEEKYVVPERCSFTEEPIEAYVPTKREARVTLLRKNELGIKDLDRFMLELLNPIILLGRKSKLFELRDPSALFYTAKGYFATNCDTSSSCDEVEIILDPMSTGFVLFMLWREFERLVSCLEYWLKPKDLLRARGYVFAEYEKLFSQDSSLAAQIATIKIYDLGFDFWDRAIDSMRSVTVDDIKELIKKYCTKSGWTVIQVGEIKPESQEST